MPMATTSALMAKTTGIVDVALRAALVARAPCVTMASTSSWTSSVASLGSDSFFPACPAELDDQVLALNIAKVAQARLQRFNAATVAGGRLRAQEADSVHLHGT